uniref:Large ribosomal subunit protein bL20 n=1 Tax=candidate division WOR-3 bacterium TaxID=2052148 RepID=A0A7C4GGP8_UNCW3
MPRVKTGAYTRQRRNKWLKQAKGYWGGKSRLYRPARQQVMKGLISSYKERKRKKRVFRSLMITRISAALEGHDLSYCRFIHGLKLAGVELDRSVLSEIAYRSAEDFAEVVNVAKAALAG